MTQSGHRPDRNPAAQQFASGTGEHVDAEVSGGTGCFLGDVTLEMYNEFYHQAPVTKRPVALELGAGLSCRMGSHSKIVIGSGPKTSRVSRQRSSLPWQSSD